VAEGGCAYRDHGERGSKPFPPRRLPAGHNARFAVAAEQPGSAFVAVDPAILADILCIQEERVVGNDNTVRYKNRTLQIPADRHRHHYVKATVRVHEYPDGGLAVFHGPRRLASYAADGTLVGGSDRQAA